MIQEKYESNVQEVSKNAVSTGFSIEINESMFQMLTSKVYNDPILAVIREWSTNACDACVVAKKEVKYDVHLPTESELYFYVRDYGTGLHPDDIVGLFSNLGASTKRNSNELNGTFGIGRMAGLAVSSGFSVESFYEGTAYSYAISVQNGVPVTINLGQQKTNEPNGLKLSVSVEVDDVCHYISKAKNLYKFFDHKPNLNIELDVNLDATNHISDDWFINNNPDRYNQSNYVVMSQVAYAIPSDSKIETFGFKNLIIKAPSGSVSFNPGRESLSLTKETVKYINNRFEEIKEEYVHSALLAISEGTNDKEVYELYTKVTNDAPYEVAKNIKPETFYSDYVNLMKQQHYNNSLAPTTAFNVLTNHRINISYKESWRKNYKNVDDYNALRLSGFFNSKHVVVDTKTKFRTALNEEYSNSDVICWTRAASVEIEDFVQEMELLSKAMGITYDLASDLITKHSDVCSQPNIPNAPREGLYASSLNYAKDGFVQSSKLRSDYIQAHTFLYVKLNNTTPVLKHPSLKFKDFYLAYQVLSKIRIMPEIKGVAKKYQPIADKLDNWVDFEDFIVERLKETKIKVPLDIDLPSFSTERISTNKLHLYPQEIQDYYSEIRDYKKFNQTNDYVSHSDQIEILKTLGATFYSYTPTREVDLDIVENVYPATLKLLEMPYFNVADAPEFISRIAKLEEYYGLRTT